MNQDFIRNGFVWNDKGYFGVPEPTSDFELSGILPVTRGCSFVWH